MSPPLSETIRMMRRRRVRRTTIIWSRTHPRRSPWTLPPSWTATWRELWRASSSRQIVQIFCRRSHTWRVSLLEQKCLLLCYSVLVLVSVRFKNSAMCGGVSVLLACCLVFTNILPFALWKDIHWEKHYLLTTQNNTIWVTTFGHDGHDF